MNTLKETLNSLKIKADIEKFEINKNVSTYYLRLHSNTTVNKLEKYSTEIALAMRSFGKPIIKPILHEGLVSVEFINEQVNDVYFSDIQNQLKASSYLLPVALGKTYDGQNLIQDFTKFPHLLIAGTTGSGKSVAIHSIINSFIASQRNVKFCLIDPKIVELSYYKNIKQLFLPTATTYETAEITITKLVSEMNQRYSILAKKSMNNIHEYNKKKSMPYIFVVIDEFADLIMAGKKSLQNDIAMLAQKGRACGIHLLISTQKPSSQVVNGIIKANFPARICFKVASATDSRIVLGQNGAEKLNGMGDALLNNDDHTMTRFKGCNITPEEIQYIVKQNNKSFMAQMMDKIL